MEKKNPFSEASKERRRLLNERNSQSTSKKALSGAENKTLTKSQLVALASKNASHLPGEIHQEK